MAGNFSFGDYFKRGAIELAWTLLTNPVDDGGYGFDPERLWATVFYDDDEGRTALAGGRRAAGRAHPASRQGRQLLVHGHPGPLRPVLEIYYDRGPEFGIERRPRSRRDRYIEIWNLVFMQNERGRAPGTISRSPGRCRVRTSTPAWVSSASRACCRTSTTSTRPTCCARSSTRWRRWRPGTTAGQPGRQRALPRHHRRPQPHRGGDHHRRRRHPRQRGRGYVLRRLLRQIIRAKLLGVDRPIMGRPDGDRPRRHGSVVPGTGRRLRPDQLPSRWPRRPRSTARWWRVWLFEDAAESPRKAGKTMLSGNDAFTPHDTYGFPIDLTLEMASRQAFRRRTGFRELMAEQRRRAKADAAARKRPRRPPRSANWSTPAPPSSPGFDELASEARILGIFVDGKRVPVVAQRHRRGPTMSPNGSRSCSTAPRCTPSPVARSPTSALPTGVGGTAKAAVTDVQKIAKTLFVHRVNVESGEFVEGDTVTAAVDANWRHGATQGHSGTHMVHAALRQVLGPNAVQAGSAEPAGLSAVRLQLAGSAERAAAQVDRDRRQRGGGGRLPGQHLPTQLGQGQGDGRDGDVRRGVSGRGPRRRDRRPVLAGTVRRHACAQLGADRAGHHPGRVVDRLGGAPRRGVRRPGLRSGTWPRNAR